MLALRNIWVILIRQKEYRNLPIQAFYSFALIAVSLRPIIIIGYWAPDAIITNIDLVQQAAKLCVGVVQDWITFELSIRIHNARGVSDISEAAKRKLSFASGVLFLALGLTFAAFSITVIVTAHGEGNQGFAFINILCQVDNIIGWWQFC